MLPVTVLFEDADVLVINKPAGLVVHSDGRTKEPTVADWILANRPEIKGVGDTLEVKSERLKVKSLELSLDRSGIVHRLDRETSGVMLIAKNQTACMRLKKQFQRGEVHKLYHAFVYGRVKHDEGVIDRPIARSRANPALWSATRGKKGEERDAVTEYRTLSRIQGLPLDSKGNPWISFLELIPRTGRTHQIRVHLKAINYPVVCDKLYLPPRLLSEESSRGGALDFTRLALHARSISFAHPTSGERMTVEAPYPPDFQKAMKRVNTAA
ncbi:MAG: RluA family pseudouridine synthase [Patescibacteria group bacterium]